MPARCQATTIALITNVRNWVLCFVKLPRPVVFLLRRNRETSQDHHRGTTFLPLGSFFPSASSFSFSLFSSFFFFFFFSPTEKNSPVPRESFSLTVHGERGVRRPSFVLRSRVWQQFQQAELEAVAVFLSPLMASWPTVLSFASAKTFPPSSSLRECDRFCVRASFSRQSTLFQRWSTPFTRPRSRELIGKWLARFWGEKERERERSIDDRVHANTSTIDERLCERKV